MGSKIAMWLVDASRWLRWGLEHVERLLQADHQFVRGGWAASNVRGMDDPLRGFAVSASLNDGCGQLHADCPVESSVGRNPIEVDEGCTAVGQSWASMKDSGQVAVGISVSDRQRFYNPRK
jgi:hypothetical protein